MSLSGHYDAVSRVWVGVAVIGVVVLSAFGLWALAEGEGSETTEGAVSSISRDGNGWQVCVEADGESQCGWVGPNDLPKALQIGDCATIELDRGAAIALDEAECP